MNSDQMRPDDEVLHQLEIFLKPRIEQAERGEVVNQTASEIIAELRLERNSLKRVQES